MEVKDPAHLLGELTSSSCAVCRLHTATFVQLKSLVISRAPTPPPVQLAPDMFGLKRAPVINQTLITRNELACFADYRDDDLHAYCSTSPSRGDDARGSPLAKGTEF
ncbi:hypothetical protein Trydic_g20077 [Trypoxylus dichotomus]